MTQGSRLRLRALEEDDLPHLVKYAQDPAVSRHLVSFRLPQGRADEKAFVRRCRESPTDHVFTIETLRGAYVGSVGFHDVDVIDRACEFGLLIAQRRHWGQGYAAEALRLGLAIGFERLNLNRLEAPVLRRNEVACSMYAQLGFLHEGTLRERRFMHGRYDDVLVFGMLRRDYRPRDNWKKLGATDAELTALPAQLDPAATRPEPRAKRPRAKRR